MELENEEGNKMSKKCKKCVYYEDVIFFHLNGISSWKDNESHPCLNCRYFPQIRKLHSDNFKEKKHKKRIEIDNSGHGEVKCERK